MYLLMDSLYVYNLLAAAGVNSHSCQQELLRFFSETTSALHYHPHVKMRAGVSLQVLFRDIHLLHVNRNLFEPLPGNVYHGRKFEHRNI